MVNALAVTWADVLSVGSERLSGRTFPISGKTHWGEVRYQKDKVTYVIRVYDILPYAILFSLQLILLVTTL